MGISKELIIGFIVFCTAPCINIVFHELGHLVVGLISHYRFISLRILGFMLYKKNDSFRLKYVGIGYSLGQACMVPKDENSYNKYYDLGGILGQLVLCVIYISLVKYIGVTALIFTLLLSLILIGITAYPLCRGGVITDGYFYKYLNVNDRLILYQSNLIHLEHTYKSYKDIDSSLYDIARTGNTLIENQNMYLAIVCKYIAQGRYDKSIVHLENLYNRVKGYNNVLTLEILSDLYTLYIIKGKLHKIENKNLKLLKKNMKKSVSCARVIYLYENKNKYRNIYYRMYNMLPYDSVKEYETKLVEDAQNKSFKAN